MNPPRFAASASALLAAFGLAACGGGTTDAVVGGSVTGLASGATVSLQENNVSTLSVTGSAAFEFPASLSANATYNVTVAAQPTGATCSVVNGTGTIDASGDAVDNVTVACQPGTAVGGIVNGLAANAALTLSDGNTSLPVGASGAFTFTDLFASGASYAVSVAVQPSGELCSVANGSGAIDANGDAVNNIVVTCAPVPLLGGTVTGLAANASISLTDGITTLPVTANGAFGFTDGYAPGASYAVSIVAQPAGQTCIVANSAGTFDAGGDSIGNVAVGCSTNGSVSGSVLGLATGGTVTLSDGVSTLAVAANGAFGFSDLFAAGAGYAITIVNQPVGQICSVANGAGTLDANDDAVTSVTVSCI